MFKSIHDWDPHATVLVGFVSLTASVDDVMKIAGALAVATGIYCSIMKELRERRAEQRYLLAHPEPDRSSSRRRGSELREIPEPS